MTNYMAIICKKLLVKFPLLAKVTSKLPNSYTPKLLLKKSPKLLNQIIQFI